MTMQRSWQALRYQ